MGFLDYITKTAAYLSKALLVAFIAGLFLVFLFFGLGVEGVYPKDLDLAFWVLVLGLLAIILIANYFFSKRTSEPPASEDSAQAEE